MTSQNPYNSGGPRVTLVHRDRSRCTGRDCPILPQHHFPLADPSVYPPKPYPEKEEFLYDYGPHGSHALKDATARPCLGNDCTYQGHLLNNPNMAKPNAKFPKQLNGPGVRHKRDAHAETRAFYPRPENEQYRTNTGTYSGKHVNHTVATMMGTTAVHSHQWSKQRDNKSSGYPRTGTGVPNTRPDSPIRDPHNAVGYHYPLPGTRAHPGPNRVVAYIDNQSGGPFSVGVTQHDPSLAHKMSAQATSHPSSFVKPTSRR